MAYHQIPPEAVAGLLDQPGTTAELVRLVRRGEVDAIPYLSDGAWVILQMTEAYRSDQGATPNLHQFIDSAATLLMKGVHNERWAVARLLFESPEAVTDLFTNTLVERQLLQAQRVWAAQLSWAPRLPPGTLNALLDLNDDKVTRSLAWNHDCSGPAVGTLADRILRVYPKQDLSYWGTRHRNFPAHPELDEKRFRRFSAIKGEFFLPGIAGSRHSTAEELDRLQSKGKPAVRLNVAMNPNTTIPTLIEMANRGPSVAQKAARSRDKVALAYGWGDGKRFQAWTEASADFTGTAVQLERHLEETQSQR